MKMQPTVENLTKHVTEIADMFHLTVIYDESLERHEAAAITLREEGIDLVSQLLGLTRCIVHVPPIKDETGYAVVMHEIGHHVAPNGTNRTPMPKPGCHPRERHAWFEAKLVAERAAWEWAKYFTEQVFEWTPSMEHVMTYALGTYLEGRRRVR